MPQVVAYRDNFAAGVLSDQMLARVASEQFGAGLRDSMNMIPTKTGSVRSVPGTYELPVTAGVASREEILYDYNAVKAYRVVFTNNLATAYDMADPLGAALSFAGGSSFKMLTAELPYMQVLQLRGMFVIVHPNHKPQTIHVSSVGVFTYDEPDIYTDTSDRYYDGTGWHGSTGTVSFATTGNYPSVVGYYATRLWFGATVNEPWAVWGSKGILNGYIQFDNTTFLFTKTSTEVSSDAVKIIESSTLGSKIAFIEGIDRLIVGTTRGVYAAATPYVSAVDDTNLGLTQFDLIWVDGTGCAQMRPVTVGRVMVFVGIGRRTLYAAEWTGEALSVADLSKANEPLLKPRIKAMAAMQNPLPSVWMVMDSGAGLVLALDAKAGNIGFAPLSRSDMTVDGDNVVRRNVWVCAMRGDVEDRILWTVSESSDLYSHCNYQAPFDPDLDEMGDGQPHNVDRGGYYHSTGGASIMPFADIVDGYEDVTGIDVFADWNPLPTAAAGTTGIELDRTVVDAHYGLPMPCYMVPTIPDIPVQGSGQSQVRGITRVAVRVVDSYGGAAGPDAATQEPMVFIFPGDYVFGDALPPFTGTVEINTYVWNDRDVSIMVSQPIPAPMEVAAVILWIAVTEVP